MAESSASETSMPGKASNTAAFSSKSARGSKHQHKDGAGKDAKKRAPKTLNDRAEDASDKPRKKRERKSSRKARGDSKENDFDSPRDDAAGGPMGETDLHPRVSDSKALNRVDRIGSIDDDWETRFMFEQTLLPRSASQSSRRRGKSHDPSRTRRSEDKLPNGPNRGSKDSLKSHEKSQRETMIKVKSPISDQYVVVSTRQIRRHSNQNPEDLHVAPLDNLPDLRHVGTSDLGAVFVEERGKYQYRPATSMHSSNITHTDVESGVEGAKSKDAMLTDLQTCIQRWTAHALHLTHGVYSGLCLLSLLLLPSFTALSFSSELSPLSDVITQSSFRFLTWYSLRAFGVSVAFNFLSTLSLFDVLDIVVRNADDGGHRVTVPWYLRKGSLWAAISMILFASISWISAALMVSLDDRLWDSQRDANFGPYGNPDWSVPCEPLFKDDYPLSHH
ncbi:hypothetical protein DFJ77DRAFT_448675 [Powellomyces hirtus]|nr:hypothetical protein DFJ77DRAFT_448675 [Powellomyces hirtus]